MNQVRCKKESRDIWADPYNKCSKGYLSGVLEYLYKGQQPFLCKSYRDDLIHSFRLLVARPIDKNDQEKLQTMGTAQRDLIVCCQHVYPPGTIVACYPVAFEGWDDFLVNVTTSEQVERATKLLLDDYATRKPIDNKLWLAFNSICCANGFDINAWIIDTDFDLR